MKYLIQSILLLTLTFAADAGNEAVVSTPLEYQRAMASKKKITVKGLVGRLLRGKTNSDFEKLSTEPGRELVFFMGSDGLSQLTSLTQDEILKVIGYPVSRITELNKQGTVYKIIVSKENGVILPGTWDNVYELVKMKYSSVVSGKIQRALPELKVSSFEKLKTKATEIGFTFTNQPNNPNFMSVEKFEKTQTGSGLRQVIEARAFLFSTLNLNEYYAGDGFTRTADGKIGMREYIALNGRLEKYLNLGAVLIENPGK